MNQRSTTDEAAAAAAVARSGVNSMRQAPDEGGHGVHQFAGYGSLDVSSLGASLVPVARHGQGAPPLLMEMSHLAEAARTRTCSAESDGRGWEAGCGRVDDFGVRCA